MFAYATVSSSDDSDIKLGDAVAGTRGGGGAAGGPGRREGGGPAGGNSDDEADDDAENMQPRPIERPLLLRPPPGRPGGGPPPPGFEGPPPPGGPGARGGPGAPGRPGGDDADGGPGPGGGLNCGTMGAPISTEVGLPSGRSRLADSSLDSSSGLRLQKPGYGTASGVSNAVISGTPGRFGGRRVGGTSLTRARPCGCLILHVLHGGPISPSLATK